MRIWKTWLCAAALAFGLPGASDEAQAQSFPSRAITLVIPFAYGLVAPAGTPRPVIDKLNKTLQAALASDEVKKQLGLDGTEITPGTPEDYAAFIDKDEKKWAQLVKASGVEQE